MIRKLLFLFTLMTLNCNTVIVQLDEKENPPMEDLCSAEVHELHQFFADWYAGRLERTAANFARFTRVMDSEFVMVTPEGSKIPLLPLTERIEAAHGSRSAQPMRIWIKNLQGRSLSEELHLVTYEEWQDEGEKPRGRLSTAVFRKCPEAPQGVQWLHLSEVWLPDS